jgi:uncharacterized protein (DUF2141 family)
MENDKTVILEIHNIITNGGKIYVFIYSSKESFNRKEAYITLEFNPINSIAFYELVIPYGEYAIATYQDENNNGILDTGWFGIPKEPVGMSNFSGKGFPPNNFDKLKIVVNNSTEEIIFGLYRF